MRICYVFDRNAEGYSESGLIVGNIAGMLEPGDKITFVKDFDYDNEFLKLAEALIEKFENLVDKEYDYFSEFVEVRLLEMERKYQNAQIKSELSIILE